ncbi:MAG: DUF1127 domain-containing protein [Proteobacteria bacterium]|nr:DUF1127 domain-containing protein [Pseudomonadota bacterium]
MSTLSSARTTVRAELPSFSFGRALALLAGTVVVGVEALLTRTELRRSRRQLAELDDRLLRDIGIDRSRARFEADKGYWA